MTTLKDVRLRTERNLQILLEKQAKQGLDVDLKLQNEIEDHQAAIEILKNARSVELTEADLAEIKEALRPLLIATNVETIALDALKADIPLFPFEPETIEISAGPFLMGSDDHEPSEAPQHEVNLPAYRIGRCPVTVAQYAEFIKQEKLQELPKKAGWSLLREPPADKLDHPVVGVSWHDAQAYCRWLSQQTNQTRVYRLPTEAEWEKAAAWAGDKKYIYPWGNEFDSRYANCREAGIGDTTPVGAYSPQGDSPSGCADMAGNVQEWTSTLWGSSPKECDYPYPYRVSDKREDLEIDEKLYRVYRVYRGGSFRNDAAKLRCSARSCSDPDSMITWRGFRVVMQV